jgi:RimJ/RimL family protein N-acetyltransferase
MSQQVVFLCGFLVTMRPIEPDDAPVLERWINDPGTRRFLQNCLPLNVSDEQEFLEKQRTDPTTVTLMIVAPDGTPIGTMGMGGISWKNGIGITGSMIGECNYRERGYGTDAKLALLQYAFNTLGLRKIKASVYDFNERSYRALLRCGYHEEGRLYSERFIDGAYRDEILMAVFRDSFEESYAAHRECLEDPS